MGKLQLREREREKVVSVTFEVRLQHK
jgi:hypothetical protein